MNKINEKEEIEKEARRLFELNAKGWRNATPWDELHEDTRRIWREHAERLEAASK